MEEKIISYCGSLCNECPAFLATLKNDNDKRKKTAEEWSKRFNADIKPEDISCEGCSPELGKKFSYCFACEIRKCAQERGVVNCARCDDYTCERLEEFFKVAPENRIFLDEIRKGL